MGITRHNGVELNGEDDEIKWNKWVQENVHYYDHWLANKAYLRAIRVTNISKSFTYKMTAKNHWHRYGTKLRHALSPCVFRHESWLIPVDVLLSCRYTRWCSQSRPTCTVASLSSLRLTGGHLHKYAYRQRVVVPLSSPMDSVETIVVVWRKRRNIIRTVLCTTVVHNSMHRNASSS